MKCSDFIAKFLKNKGIKTVFDYTGGMIANLEDSISRLQGIDCLPMRHEQAAGFAAEGYARSSHNFGVAISTSGPGATNLITAIGSCYFDSIPALFITGQVNTKELKRSKNIRQSGFQELDIVEMVSSVTKYAKLVLEPNDILYELEKAEYRMKNERPGPVLLDIPFNVQSSEIDTSTLRKFIGSAEHKNLINDTVKDLSDFSAVADLLKQSRAPIVLFGNGIKTSRTKNKLKKFLDQNNIPSVSSLLGLGELASSQKNYLGFIGTYGTRYANIALASSDLIIALGSRMDLRQTGNPNLFANKTKIIHVDIDKFSIKNEFSDYIFINANLNDFFDNLSDIDIPSKSKWLDFIGSIKEIVGNESINESEPCNPNLFFEFFSEMLPENATVVADVGQNQMWLAQSWKIKDGQTLMFSGGMGAMGFSLPATVGAYCANKDPHVYAFMGDGGFQINIQELETISHNKLPIKVVVLNNKSLGMVREFQGQYFNKNYQSTVVGYSCPDLEKIANAYSLKYFKIDKSNNIEAFREIINFTGPAIIEVELNREATLQPKVVYGESIENQAPFLSDKKRERLKVLKDDLFK